MHVLTHVIIGGLAIGAIYAIVALGFVVVFKATSVLNFAHGAFLMLGTYLALTVFGALGWPFIVGLLVIATLFAVLGVVLHYSVMRWMVGEPFFSVVLVTIGFEILIRVGLLTSYGPDAKGRVMSLPAGSFYVGKTLVPWTDVITAAAALASVSIFFLFFKYTRVGLHMRAVADNLEAAAAQGIDPNRIYAAAWAIGLFMAGVGGVLYSQYTPSIDLDLGSIGLRAFPAAIIGGLTSPGGAIIGGLLVGIVETAGVTYLGANWRDPLAFGVMFVVLLLRPSGLFGERQLVRI